MGDKVTAFALWMLLVIVNAIKLETKQKWVPDFGWDVTCTWQIPSNDTLQSVRLYNDGKQFMIYRPETFGPRRRDEFRSPDMLMIVNCQINFDHDGQCEIRVEPLKPIEKNFALKCEVSGERPTFIMAEKEEIINILVPPTNASLVSTVQQADSQTHVSLNCSSFGLPGPNLQWTIEGEKPTQADLGGRAWNETSKLWHVWSFLSYTADSLSTVSCTPVTTVEGQIYKGVPAEFNSATRYLSTSLITLTAFSVLQYLR